MRSLRQTFGAARYELRLLFRDSGLRALFVLTQIGIGLYVWHYGFRTGRPPEALLAGFAEAYGPVLSVVIAVLAAQTLRRAPAEGTEELFETFPTKATTEFWGKVAAFAPVPLILASEPLLIYFAFASDRPEAPGLMLYHGLFLAANFSLATAFGAAAAAFIRRGVLSYMAAASSWIAYTFLVNMAYGELGLSWVSLGMNFSAGWSHHRPDVLWGAGLGLDLAASQYGFLAAASLGLLAVAALLYKRWRHPGQPRILTCATLLVAAVAATLLGGVYLDTLGARLSYLEDQIALEHASAGAPAPAECGLVEALGYDLEVWLGPDRTLRARADVVVVNTGEEPIERIPLTLNGALALEETTVDGRPAQVERWGHRLAVRLPEALSAGESCLVRLCYGGQVWLWNLDGWYRLEPAAVVGAAGTLLPAGFGWYPLPGYELARPGADPLFDVHPGSAGHGPALSRVICWRTSGSGGDEDVRLKGLAYPDGLALRPTPFSLTVHAPPGQDIESNLELVSRDTGLLRFEGLAEGGCYLLGAPDVFSLTEPVSGATVAGAPSADRPDSRSGPTLKVVGPGALSDDLACFADYAAAALAFVTRLETGTGRGAAGGPGPTTGLCTVSVIPGPSWSELRPPVGGSIVLSRVWRMETTAAFERLDAASRTARSIRAFLEGEEIFRLLLDRSLGPVETRPLDPSEPVMVREAYKSFARAVFLGERYGESVYQAARTEALEGEHLPRHLGVPEHAVPENLRGWYLAAVEVLFEARDRRGAEAALNLLAHLYEAVRGGRAGVRDVVDAAAGAAGGHNQGGTGP